MPDLLLILLLVLAAEPQAAPPPEAIIHRGCVAYRLHTPRDGVRWQCKP
jgi:hypothetical protein